MRKMLVMVAAALLVACQPMLTVDDAGYDAGPDGGEEWADDGGPSADDGGAGDEAAAGDGDLPGDDWQPGDDGGSGDGDDPSTCGLVTFSYDAGNQAVSEVLVSGTFNGWAGTVAEGAWPLSDDDSDGTWQVTRRLDSGHHLYKFVVDGSWIADPGNPNREDDGYGGYNSVLDIDCEVHLEVLSYASDDVTGHLEATLRLGPAPAVLDPDSVAVSLDHQPLDAGDWTVAGNDIEIALDGLADGYHDLRVDAAAGDGRRAAQKLLKFALGVSPDWQDALLYFAMIDRFANGNAGNDAPLADVDTRTNYQGGDFAGLRQKIEAGYFDDLGVSALWITWPGDNLDGYAAGARADEHYCGMNAQNMATAPMNYSAYHGYWPVELDRPEEHFGTWQELEQLVDVAHAHGIRILLDFVANHVHVDSPLYQEHKDDFFNWPDNGSQHVCAEVGWDVEPETCWFTPYLADIDYRNPAAVEYMVELALEWIRRTGADGFRLDAVKHVNRAFVYRLRERLGREIETTGNTFYLVGETFTGDAALIASYLGAGQIHGQFDFPLNMQVLMGFATRQVGLNEMNTAVRLAKSVYSDAYADSIMSNFLGNHDIARFISLAAGDIACGVWDVVSNIAQGWLAPPGTPSDPVAYDMLRLAFTYIMTVPGIPLIYYGDEIGLPGAGDPDNRRLMLFGAQLDADQQALLEFMKRLGGLRASQPLLRTGDWGTPLLAEADLLVYPRSLGDRVALVVLNRGDADRSLDLDVSALLVANGTKFTDGLDPTSPQATVSAGHLGITARARTPAIWLTP